MGFSAVLFSAAADGVTLVLYMGKGVVNGLATNKTLRRPVALHQVRRDLRLLRGATQWEIFFCIKIIDNQ